MVNREMLGCLVCVLDERDAKCGVDFCVIGGDERERER